MKILTKHTDYALAALCALAQRDGDRMTVAEMSKELQIPYAFLRRLLLALAQAGVVQSHQGQRGGYTLKGKPATIRVGAIVELFQGPVSFTDCYVQNTQCSRRMRCKLRKKLRQLEAQFIKDLCNMSLSELT
ncbi:RrF2 family transcriptional regulator [Planctomycetota bacterium]